MPTYYTKETLAHFFFLLRLPTWVQQAPLFSGVHPQLLFSHTISVFPPNYAKSQQAFRDHQNEIQHPNRNIQNDTQGESRVNSSSSWANKHIFKKDWILLFPDVPFLLIKYHRMHGWIYIMNSILTVWVWDPACTITYIFPSGYDCLVHENNTTKSF